LDSTKNELNIPVKQIEHPYVQIITKSLLLIAINYFNSQLLDVENIVNSYPNDTIVNFVVKDKLIEKITKMLKVASNMIYNKHYGFSSYKFIEVFPTLIFSKSILAIAFNPSIKEFLKRKLTKLLLICVSNIIPFFIMTRP
jgi:hypothetical protein